MVNKKNTVSRREFIKKSSVGVAGAFLAPTILSASAKGANDRILIGHIGVGSQGTGELQWWFTPLDTALQVATCDPFLDRRKAAAEYVTKEYKKRGVKAPKIKTYLDMDELLERSDIDAVHITTPDHWHVLAAIKAARAGKHIYLANPLGLSYPNYTILEKEIAANHVKFQYGTQQRAQKHLQIGIDMVRNGLIGEIEKIDVWAPGYNDVPSPVCNEVPVPKDFDYDRWTGPAPLNPYCPDRVTNNSSWFQWDYSIGFLGGWGAHPLDVMVWGAKDQVKGSYTCEGVGEYWKPGGMYNNIRGWDIHIEYDSGVKLHFADADRAQNGNMLDYLKYKEGDGTTFFGTKGWISLARGKAESNIPELEKKFREMRDEKGNVHSPDKHIAQYFVDTVKGNRAETNPLDEAIISDCVSHMSNIAIRTGRKIKWDPVKGEVVGDPEAFKWFVRDMREPYTV